MSPYTQEHIDLLIEIRDQISELLDDALNVIADVSETEALKARLLFYRQIRMALEYEPPKYAGTCVTMTDVINELKDSGRLGESNAKTFKDLNEAAHEVYKENYEKRFKK